MIISDTKLLTNEGVTYTLTGVNSINVKRGENQTKNYMDVTLDVMKTGQDDNGYTYSFQNTDRTSIFSIMNTDNNNDIDEDFVSFYITNTDDPTITVVSDSYLIFSGIINSIKSKTSSKSDKITLKTRDRNTALLNRIGIPEDIKLSNAINSPEIIQKIVRQSTDDIPSGVTAFDDSGNSILNSGYLVDARLFSAGIKESGTLTGVSGLVVTDSGADFSDVNKDDWIRNTTSEKYAYVVSVSGTSLTLNKDIFETGDTYEVSDGFIQDTRPDGNEFPDILFSQLNKPVVDNIMEAGQPVYTNTYNEYNKVGAETIIVRRPMRSFVDKNNRFHWYYPEDTPALYLEMGSQAAISPDTSWHKIIEDDLTKEIDNTINYIVFESGKDFEGNLITYFYYKDFSGTPNKQDAYRVYNSINYNLKQQAYHSITGGYRHAQYSNNAYTYPNAGIYPFTPSFSTTSVANDSEYNAAFKAKVISECQNRAQKEVDKLFSPRWKGTIKLQGEDIPVGELISYTKKSQGIYDIKLRVLEVNHFVDIKASAWITTLKVEEDEPLQI